MPTKRQCILGTNAQGNCIPGHKLTTKKDKNEIAVIFVALIFTAEIAVGQLLWPGQQPMTCGENKIFKQCANKANRCEPSCAVPKPMICTLMCGQGCDCQDGFLRSQNGKCVRPNQC
uniref:TIL domain-containing protein n=1 Tax=Panagrolaimus sp. ES5 TaxID=591445 RepID=A0AC34FXD3_9BILA